MKKEILDIKGVKVVPGSIIDLHQTVNGQNIFIVMDLEKGDIRYGHDLNYKYQYSAEEMFKSCHYSGSVEFEVIGNITAEDNPNWDRKKCTECEGSGLIIDTRIEPRCCMNFTESGGCCNYPVPDQVQDVTQCQRCKATGLVLK